MKVLAVAFLLSGLSLFISNSVDNNIYNPTKQSNNTISEQTFTPIKTAHVIGSDSRTPGFIVSKDYYASEFQSELAEDNLAHLKCTKHGANKHQNTTSAFFLDIKNYAENNGIAGDFSGCKNKIAVSVAHYINDKGGAKNVRCLVLKSFDTGVKKKASGGKVINIVTGSTNTTKQFYEDDNSPALDFSLLELDYLRLYSGATNDLKICNTNDMNKLQTTSVCNGDFKDKIILPQISRSRVDPYALANDWSYKAKETSGRCCIEDYNYLGAGEISHTCDMHIRASGSPLLNITKIDAPCVIGVQSSHAKGRGTTQSKNFAVSIFNSPHFRIKMTEFADQLSCKM